MPAQRSGTLRGKWGEGMLSRASENAAGATRVVLVEDQDDARQMLSMLLESRGLEVTTAADGIQGAALDVKLRHLDEWNAQRRAAAARYSELLGGISGLRLPVTTPGARLAARSTTTLPCSLAM